MPRIPSPSPEKVDYAALADFRHALRQFMAFSEERAAEHGLTPQQHQALLAIRGSPTGQMTVGDLARGLLIKPNSASGLVDRLQSLGLVERGPSESDGRRASILLTADALERLERLSSTHQEELRRLRPMFMALLTRID